MQSRTNPSFVRSGSIYISISSLQGADSEGTYWSNSSPTSPYLDYPYRLGVYADSVAPSSRSNNRWLGQSLRCLAS